MQKLRMCILYCILINDTKGVLMEGQLVLVMWPSANQIIQFGHMLTVNSLQEKKVPLWMPTYLSLDWWLHRLPRPPRLTTLNPPIIFSRSHTHHTWLHTDPPTSNATDSTKQDLILWSHHPSPLECKRRPLRTTKRTTQRQSRTIKETMHRPLWTIKRPLWTTRRPLRTTSD